MRRQSDGFSGSVTPLFDIMIVQASKEVGENSDHLTDSNQISIDTQPSTSKPQKKQKSRRKQRIEAEVPQDDYEHEESVPTPSNDPQPSGEDSMQLTKLMLLCTKLQKQVLELEKAKTDQAIKIASLKKGVKKLEMKRKSRPAGLRRLKKLNNKEMFGANDLHGEEVTVKDTAAEVIVKDTVAPIIPVTTAETIKVVTTAATSATTVAITAAATLVTTIAVTRPKAKGIVFYDQEEQVFVSKPTISSTQPSIKDKGKEIMIEPERPLKRKDQIAADEELARQLDAEMQVEIEEEERIRRQKEEEANILIELWENKQAMMEAGRLLAERLQTREKEELTIEEKSKLFVELMNKRRKHFTKLRAQEKRNKPPTKAQKKNMKRVNSFIPIDTDDRTDKEQERSSKSVGDDLESDVSKKQRVDEQ
ncbi:hypothetical protein Tco_0510793 [Tanacetum coccineum]